jgi:hypothetical protein
MDSSKPPKPDLLLDDLEAIRQLLEKEQLEPPLLTETLDDDLQIPVLSEIIEPGPDAPAAAPLAAVTLSYPVQPAVAPPQPPRPAPATPSAASIGSTVQQSLAAQGKLDAELRAAAQLILQDVIDDFVPQIEAELKRRLDARLDRLLKQPKA